MANPSFESSSAVAASSGLTTATATLNTTTGRLLVAWIASYNVTATISDTQGGTPNLNTWVPGPSYTAGLGRMRMYYVLSCIGGAGHQFVATTPGGDYPTITVQQYNWNGSTGTFDQSNTDFVSGAATAHSTGNITTTNAGALLVAGGSSPGNTAYSVDSPFTQDRSLATGSVEGIVTGYRIPGSTGTYDCDITTSVAVSLRSIIASFYPAGGATQFNVSVSGAVTPTGAIIKAAQRAFAGASTPAGAIARQVRKLFDGSVTPAGALANIKTILLNFAGTVASTGALVRSVGKNLAGLSTPAGALVRQVQKTLAGAVTPSGALALTKSILITLAGSVATAGGLIRQVGKNFGGSITPTGAIARHLSVSFSGTVAASGLMFKQIGKIFTGVVASLGALVNQFLGQLFIFNPPLSFEVTIVRAVSFDATIVQGVSFEVSVG